MRIVVALDGSSAAAGAASFVRYAAWPPGTRVRIVSALGDVALRLGTAITPGEGLAVDAAARTALEIAQREASLDLTRQGLDVEAAIVPGRPADAILAAARALPADLVVLGSRGLGPVAALLLGSVSAEVVLRAPTSVLVIRSPLPHREPAEGAAIPEAGADRASGGQPAEPVVLAMDGSPAARAAEHAVATWPLFRSRTVWVIGVDRPAPGRGTDIDDARSPAAAATHAARRLRAAGLDAIAQDQTGDAAAEILRAAEGVGARLVVVGAGGAGGGGRSRLGSVARNVVTAGPSVLVVRRPSARPRA